jgi:thiol-disulfide isomerase/thioredoxin
MRVAAALATAVTLAAGAPAAAPTTAPPAAAPPAAPAEVPVGATLPDTPLYGLTLDYRRLADFRGKPLVINVWASWCGPCRDEMASLDRLARRHNGRQFHIIGISTDDYAEKAQAFVVGTGVSFDNYLDKGLVLERLLGADRLPLTVFVDARGKVLRKVYGAREWDSRENRALIAATLRVRLD